MKRIRIELEQIAEHANLLSAFHKAARGKHHRQDVKRFIAGFDSNINRLGDDIRMARLPYGGFREFEIYDPKRRLIHAACFEDRIFHHALMNHAEPVLERTLSPFSYACRKGKGVHKLAGKVQQHLRSYPFYGQIDISGYFPAIRHSILLDCLMKRFKGLAIRQQLERIINSYHSSQGSGLPIGALTSQVFANYYLDGLDRLLASLPMVRGQYRYMDDTVWWCDSRQDVVETLQIIRQWLAQYRGLEIKPSVQIQHSSDGISWCGNRIRQGSIGLSRRKKRRYQQRRLYWEQQYQEGRLDSGQLQQAYAAVHSIVAGTDSLAWRQGNLQRHPSIEV